MIPFSEVLLDGLALRPCRQVGVHLARLANASGQTVMFNRLLPNNNSQAFSLLGRLPGLRYLGHCPSNKLVVRRQ